MVSTLLTVAVGTKVAPEAHESVAPALKKLTAKEAVEAYLILKIPISPTVALVAKKVRDPLGTIVAKNLFPTEKSRYIVEESVITCGA